MSNNTSTKALGDLLTEKYHIKTPINTGIPLIYRDGFYDDLYSQQFIKQNTNQLLIDNPSTHKVKEVLDYIIRKTYFSPDYEKNYICLENGHLNLETLELEEFSPDRLITFKIPVKFNRDANLDPWRSYISSLIPSLEDCFKLQEHFGNILAPHYITKKALHMFGPKHSGKSTIISIIQDFLGKRNYSNLSLYQIGEKFTNAQIYKKHANFSADLPYDLKIKHYGIIKSLTGGDTLTLQFKYKDPFEYTNIAKIFFSANGIPQIDQQKADNAFYGRWDFIEFPNSFEPDETIFRRYTTPEMKSVILRWMIIGYKRLRENHWRFTNELSIEKIKAMFNNIAYPTRMEDIWLCENYIPSLQGWTRKKEIYSSYEDYCGRNNVPALDYRTFCRWILNQNLIPVSDFNPSVEGIGQVHAFKCIEKRL